MLWLVQEPYNMALHWERNQCWKIRQCSLLYMEHSDPGMRKLTNSMCASPFFRNHRDTCLIFRIFFFQYLRYLKQLKAKHCSLSFPKRSAIRKPMYQNLSLVHWFSVPKHQPQEVCQKYSIKVFVGLTKTLKFLQIIICLSFPKTTFSP